VLATIGEGIWDWDIASGTVRHNRVWCQMLGRPEESLTHTRDGFLALAHPDDRSSVAAAIEACLRGGSHTSSTACATPTATTSGCATGAAWWNPTPPAGRCGWWAA
jgi:PAS domain-containing protein